MAKPFSVDQVSFCDWPEDNTGITPQRVYTANGCLCTSSKERRVYRYVERPIDRDVATRFYDNPYMLVVGVQRVAVVDEDAGEIMICTPSRAATWMILRNRGREDAVVSEVNQLDDITQQELDDVLNELRRRRNGTIQTDAAENGGIPTKMIIKEGDTKGQGKAKVWELTGFADNGGWAKFFEEVMTEGNKWLAVIQGQTTAPNVHIPSDPGKFDLVFKDNESELLYGEGRIFRSNDVQILGVQLRRGYCVIRPGSGASDTALPYDQFVLPKGLEAGVFSNKRRELSSGLVWRIRSGEALTHLTLGGEDMKIA